MCGHVRVGVAEGGRGQGSCRRHAPCRSAPNSPSPHIVGAAFRHKPMAHIGSHCGYVHVPRQRAGAPTRHSSSRGARVSAHERHLKAGDMKRQPTLHKDGVRHDRLNPPYVQPSPVARRGVTNTQQSPPQTFRAPCESSPWIPSAQCSSDLKRQTVSARIPTRALLAADLRRLVLLLLRARHCRAASAVVELATLVLGSQSRGEANQRWGK